MMFSIRFFKTKYADLFNKDSEKVLEQNMQV